jgi:hypothetical protein
MSSQPNPQSPVTQLKELIQVPIENWWTGTYGKLVDPTTKKTYHLHTEKPVLAFTDRRILAKSFGKKNQK